MRLDRDSTNYVNLGFVPFGEAQNIPGKYTERVLAVEEFFKRQASNITFPKT